ncbi:hypothetical protein V1264_003359 [Littorina saxatilis]|uniref:RING-type E3 ubiquitin transferase n=2 Tax=Littorina saxatilis TaxID=31220 RepID=A0AAN9B5F0_9CAEN
MDDSGSDDINVVSSDDDRDEDDDRELIDDDDVIVSDNDDDDDVIVSDNDDGVTDEEEGDVEVISTDGAPSDHGSPGDDEVVVVESNVLVEESSDDEESTDGEDERGQEAEEDTVEAEGIRAQSAADLQVQPATSVTDRLSQPGPSQNPPQRPEGITLVQTPSASGENAASSAPDVDLPGPSGSQNTPVAGPSSSQTQNTSLNDFQTPVLRRPGMSAVLAAATASSNESIVEFRSPKRRRIMSPEKSTDKGDGKSTADEDDDDGNNCSICFEPWDNSGKHRLSSLKCGHLFGLSCIEKWLKGQGGKCPSCNEKAKMKDIRVIYAKAIKMMDTTERDRALHELEKEKEQRRRAELEAAQVRLQCQQCMDEGRRLREELDRLRGELSSMRSHRGGGVPLSQASQSQPSSSQVLQGRFTHDKTVKIWEGGQCRVLAHCPSMAALVMSQPSANRLFPGYGVKKLSCLDFKTSSYMTLHQKALRAISFHPTVDDGILLSVSMDKTVKLTSMLTNTVVQTYNTTLPLWSCEWNADNQNYFYVGQQNGRVLEFDTRNTAAHVRELNEEGSKSPVVALQYMSRNINAAFKPGGLIVGQLDRVSFFEAKGDNEHRLHILPLEGNLTSLNVDPSTRHMLASFRPTAKHPTVRHQLCELTSTQALGDTVISCNGVHTFHGGRAQSVLGRTMLLPHPADESRLLVVAGDEQTESTHLWDTGTSQLVQRLPCQGVPVDFSTFTHNNKTYLAALTDKFLKLHRWN